jgi:hypothetical protein
VGSDRVWNVALRRLDAFEMGLHSYQYHQTNANVGFTKNVMNHPQVTSMFIIYANPTIPSHDRFVALAFPHWVRNASIFTYIYIIYVVLPSQWGFPLRMVLVEDLQTFEDFPWKNSTPAEQR